MKKQPRHTFTIAVYRGDVKVRTGRYHGTQWGAMLEANRLFRIYTDGTDQANSVRIRRRKDMSRCI